MLNRVTEILIGKDISRDAQVVAGAAISVIQATTGLADGEIVALDKNMKVLAAGASVADSDTIYIAQGTSSTFTIPKTSTTARRIHISNPIQASQVRSYKGTAYTATTEKSWLLDLDNVSATVTNGVEYILKFVYSDVVEYPTKFTQSYRISNAVSEGDLIYKLGEKINNHSTARVTATVLQSDGTTAATSAANANQLKITGKAIPACTTSVNDIDEFSQVNFDVFMTYIDSDGVNQTFWSQSDGITTDAVSGSGIWEKVRDTEKWSLGYEGISNFTHFPVIKPDFKTVKDATYNQIVIEHNPKHLSPYNSDVATDPVTTIIAIPVESSGTQMTSVLAQLNPWFASCPGAFANVTF